MSIVKRQHYVWRAYLRAWASNDSIYTYILDKNKVEKTSLMKVAQEKYFYKLIELSDFEIEQLEKFISKSHESLHGIQGDVLFAFKSYTYIKRQLNENPIPQIADKLREIEVNSLEKTHGMIEGFGGNLISCRTKEDFDKLFSNSQEKYKAIIYLCVQYLRTRRMKNLIKDAFKGETKKILVNTWSIFSFVLATNIAMNVALNPDLKVRFFNNINRESFLTGDQPVINLLAEDIDKNGHVKKIEFYYPISPEVAITIHFDERQTETVDEIFINESMLEYFNQFLADNSEKFVFSSSLDDLVTYRGT